MLSVLQVLSDCDGRHCKGHASSPGSHFASPGRRCMANPSLNLHCTPYLCIPGRLASTRPHVEDFARGEHRHSCGLEVHSRSRQHCEHLTYCLDLVCSKRGQGQPPKLEKDIKAFLQTCKEILKEIPHITTYKYRIRSQVLTIE